MFFCIKNNIDFYIISEKQISEIDGLSFQYKKFLYKLKRKNRLIYLQNISCLISKLKH